MTKDTCTCENHGQPFKRDSYVLRDTKCPIHGNPLAAPTAPQPTAGEARDLSSWNMRLSGLEMEIKRLEQVNALLSEQLKAERMRANTNMTLLNAWQKRAYEAEARELARAASVSGEPPQVRSREMPTREDGSPEAFEPTGNSPPSTDVSWEAEPLEKSPVIGGDGPPVASCLLCGHHRQLAVWYAGTRAGVCADCRARAASVSVEAEPQKPDPLDAIYKKGTISLACSMKGCQAAEMSQQIAALTDENAALKEQIADLNEHIKANAEVGTRRANELVEAILERDTAQRAASGTAETIQLARRREQ